MARAIGSLTKYPARFSVLSYALVIIAGAALLTTSAAVVPGKDRLTAIDALFTATSAACVTGLTVRSTANDLSFLGQAVVLTLIQVGGIGIVTITTFITFHLRGGGVRDRAMASEAIGAQRPTDFRSTLSSVLWFTLLVEAVAALVLTVRGLLDDGIGRSAWHAVFHSISAYCNAGFALHDTSLTRYQGDVVVNTVIGMLIVVGGIGFPVIVDIRRQWHKPWGQLWDHLHLHSKMMLIGTALLIVGGAVVFLSLESHNSMTNMSWPRRIIVSLFSSITARTAGFNSIDIGSLTNATLFMLILLMIIGAGPCSTGGGMKVSTFMVVVLSGWSTWRGNSRVNLMRRTIASAVVDRAITTVLLFGAVSIIAITALLMLEQSSYSHQDSSGVFLDTVFEVISALGTVGLSTGITTRLADASRLVLVVVMFIGRLGPISIAVAISHNQRRARIEYPESEPLIG